MNQHARVEERPIPFIDVAAQRRRLGRAIDDAVARVLAHCQFIQGPEVHVLEAELAAFCGARHAIGCASGTDALLLVLMAWQIGPGDAVICPSFTYHATAEMVALLGATPIIADVLPDSPFFPYAETSAAAGVIGGYACGGSNPATGAAEPCDGANRPYYRPGNNVTRGQLSKIIMLAQGWSANTTGGPHFSDVAVGSTFYIYIETAVNHGIINGYSDGTFRPANNATRGQISKIVWLSLTQP